MRFTTWMTFIMAAAARAIGRPVSAAKAVELVLRIRYELRAHNPEYEHIAPEWGRMLALLPLLDLAPGMRVLQIGVGHGLVSVATVMITETPPVAVDLDEHRVHAVSATITGHGMSAHMVHADGYIGYPPAAPYDRIVSTVTVPGLSPRWTAQLAPGGMIVAPVQLGPTPTIVRATVDADGTLTGRLHAGKAAVGWPAASGKLACRCADAVRDTSLGPPAATSHTPVRRSNASRSIRFGEHRDDGVVLLVPDL